MKTKLLFTTLLSFVFYLLSSQIPQGFNYQAIVRNTSGEVLQNKSIKVTVAIKTALSGGIVFWEEYHDVISNQFGLVTFKVGSGTFVSGTITSFDKIDWKAQALYLKTIVEYPVGTTTDMGTAQILSVPYSLVAKDVEGPIGKLGIKSTEINNDSALFKVINKDGKVVFAVYNEGVRIQVSDDTKGKKGGFAVGGFGTGKTGESQPYLYVTSDSIRMYLDSNIATKQPKGGFAVGGFDMAKGKVQPYLNISKDSVRIYIDTDTLTKKPKGGFAVGGFDLTKRVSGEYLRVTRDSTRIYVNDGTKGVKGGFAVGSFDGSKGEATNFTSLTPDNYLIGHRSGSKISLGKFNSFLGYETGMKNTIGESNVFLGYLTGHENISGSNNVAVGNNAGYAGTSGASNVLLGDSAGYSNTASFNVMLGKGSGKNNTGDYNTFLGYQAGIKNTNGEHNVYLGYKAGYVSTGQELKGSYNVVVGNLAGFDGSGSSNVFLGDSSGYKSQASYNVFLGKGTGKISGAAYNVFMGYEAGMRNNTGASNVYIGYRSAFKQTQGGDNVYIGSETGFNSSSIQRSVFIGPQAGRNVNTGADNVFIGDGAGRGQSTLATGGSNVFVGTSSGMNFSTGYNNVFIGKSTGNTLSSGYNNVLLGMAAGSWVFTGNSNVMIGSFAGTNTYGVADNTIVGTDAGRTNVSGVGNTYIGRSAGFTNKGKYNIFIGREAGYLEDTTSYKLFIQPNKSATPLIWGDFILKYANINGSLGINTKTPAAALHIKGNQGILNLEGTDHCYIQFYPDTYAGGRKAFFGFPSAGSNDVSLANQIAGGNIVFTPGTETAGSGYIGLLGPTRISQGTLYDVWIQGGNSTLMGNARNLALVGYIPDDKLFINYDGEYAGGTWLNGLVYMPQVYSTTVSSPHTLYINSAGQVGGVSSSIKYKENIYDLDNYNWLFKLRPVIYNYKNTSPTEIQYGMIAEEVQEINPLLVIYGSDNKPDGLMYERLTVPMLKAIQDQKKEIESLQDKVSRLEKMIELMQVMMEQDKVK